MFNNDIANTRVNDVISDITQWHYDRNLIDGADDYGQLEKLDEEVAELSLSIVKGNSPIDDIGDIIVVLINIAERHGLTIEQCLEHAYNDIKDRKGKLVNGVFVKEQQ
jgi:uncharacterized protein YabN with tetrapyrrole methylase and pyrophosphatase domain